MKIIKSLAALSVSMLCLSASAQTEWLHVYRNDGKFHTMPTDSVSTIAISSRSNGVASSMKITPVTGKSINVTVSSFSRVDIGATVPSIYITTDEPIDDVHDKVTYIPAKITVKSYGYPGMEDIKDKEMKLRGRGNSTLGMPKKPYRIKFDKKTAMHSSLRSAKNYVLLANYIDNTLLRNSVAFATAQLLDLPYTPHAVPVNVWLNDIYRGSYVLCEKTGLNSGNVYDIEETEGILLELDTNIDPTDTYFPSESSVTGFPVAIKDPDFAELEEDGDIPSAKESMAVWEQDYRRLEKAVMGESGEDWADLIDLESAVRYVMTYNLTGNCELKHPKSVLIYKAKLGEKYYFGPIWDFDWAFTYDGWEGVQRPDVMLFGPANSQESHLGTKFFMNIVKDPRFMKRYGEVWEDFAANKFPELLERYDSMAKEVAPSAALNGEKWNDEHYNNSLSSTAHFDNNVATLRNWLISRVEFISNTVNYGMFIDYTVTDEAPEGMKEVKLSTDNVVASDPDSTEGPLEDLFDNNPETFYHSDYHSNDRHDPVYGSYLDITLPEATTEVGFDIKARAKNLNGLPTAIDIYGMSEGSDEWVKIGTANSIDKVISSDSGVMDARLCSYKSKNPINKVRFAVIESRSGFAPLTIDLSEFNIYTYWNLAELKMYVK